MKKILFFLLIFVSTIYFGQPVIDGDLTDAQYTTIATKLNSNAGFGAAIDITKIVYYADVTNSILYFGIVGKLDVNNTNEIGVWLNVTGTSSPTGVSAGNALGGVSGVGSFMGDATNTTFDADFEVDYQFAFNPGSGTSNVYFDAAKMVGTPAGHYQGTTDQSGTAANNDQEIGTVFTVNSINWAFNNGGGVNQGLEMKIPFSEIGATSTMSIEVFAFVVSGTAFFSDVSVPGDINGNPGFNPSFNSNLRSDGSTPIGTAPFHSSPSSPLPVELTSFSANIVSEGVQLNWTTATEVDNYGFSVERKSSFAQSEWQTLGFVQGRGNSNSPKEYSFLDNGVTSGKYAYRLKQIDTDGAFEYSDVIEVDVGLPAKYELFQNYPNPFSKGSGGNPATTIGYSLPEAQYVRLAVFNVLGEEVALLVNEKKEAGKYNITFDAANLPSGLYLYSLQTENFSKTKKMMLLK